MLTAWFGTTKNNITRISPRIAVVKKEAEPKPTGFTIDAVLVKQAESKLKEGEELVEATNGDIFRELKELRTENEFLHKKSTRVDSWM